MCILFSWSPIYPNKEGVAHINENCHVCMCILFPLFTYFPKHGGGYSEKWDLHCMYVYNIPLNPLFPQHGWSSSQQWELQCIYMCMLFPWSPIFPTWSGLLREIIIPMSVCVYYSLDQPISPNMEGVAHINENCNVCMCILFPWSHVSPTWRSCSQKWELPCMYVYIIPMVTYYPKHGGGYLT